MHSTLLNAIESRFTFIELCIGEYWLSTDSTLIIRVSLALSVCHLFLRPSPPCYFLVSYIRNPQEVLFETFLHDVSSFSVYYSKMKFQAKCVSFLCVSLSCFAVSAKFCSALFKDKSLNKLCVFSLCLTLLLDYRSYCMLMLLSICRPAHHHKLHPVFL